MAEAIQWRKWRRASLALPVRTRAGQLHAGVSDTLLAAGLGATTHSPPLTKEQQATLAPVLDYDDGVAVLHQAIQYLVERSMYEDSRWLDALGRSRIPTTLIWGDRNVGPAFRWCRLPCERRHE